MSMAVDESLLQTPGTSHRPAEELLPDWLGQQLGQLILARLERTG